MRIIKKGKERVWRLTCGNCMTLFDFTLEDTFVDICRKVKCPECNHELYTDFSNEVNDEDTKDSKIKKRLNG